MILILMITISFSIFLMIGFCLGVLWHGHYVIEGVADSIALLRSLVCSFLLLLFSFLTFCFIQFPFLF